MRTKFNSAKEPTENEKRFIDYIERTNDHFGYSERTLALFLHISQRKVRLYKERYNNFKYIGIVPQGKIHNINKLYRLITIDSKYCAQSIRQSTYNLITAAIDKRNTSKILGDLQHSNQLSIFDIVNMSYEELVEQAKSYEKLLEVE